MVRIHFDSLSLPSFGIQGPFLIIMSFAFYKSNIIYMSECYLFILTLSCNKLFTHSLEVLHSIFNYFISFCTRTILNYSLFITRSSFNPFRILEKVTVALVKKKAQENHTSSYKNTLKNYIDTCKN